MKESVRFVLCVLLLVFSRMMPAQNLPALQTDAAITVGALQNGISYYLVTNPAMKGIADYALVRKGAADTLSTRKELSSLPHFNKTVPYRFLARKGIGCRPEGYFTIEEGHTVFRFDEVPVFDAAAADTTLLMLFDLIGNQPFQHAIVIAGDINAANILQKMNVFQMMVPARAPSYQPPVYVWAPSDSMASSFRPSPDPSMTLEVRSPRAAPDKMNTIVPFISRMYASELEQIASARLEEALRARGIPPQSQRFSYSGSDASSGDERLCVHVGTSQERLIPTSLAVASSLSTLGKDGAGLAEYQAARQKVIASFRKAEDNDALVRKCIGHYLHGTDLASNQTKVNFFTSRNIPAETELNLFNAYVKALLDSVGHAALHFEGDAEEYDPWGDPLRFSLTWRNVAAQESPAVGWSVGAADTTSFPALRGKTKLKTIAPEPVSGGEIWTFSNGMRVIYKKQPAGGRIYCSVMVKGGYSSAKGLQKGEGAYFSDMLGLYDVAGLSGTDFRRVLLANGVDLRTHIGVSDIRLDASAPPERFILTLKALLCLANERKLNPAAYERYRTATQACLQQDYLDGLMYPEYLYSDVKTPEGLTNELPARADAFFSDVFLRMNDGVMLILGDMPADNLQKALASCLGSFRVSRLSASRPPVPYKIRTGSTTYTLSGSSNLVTVALAAQMPYTTENYMAFRVACLTLQRRLSGTLAEYGYSVSSSAQFRVSPADVMEVVFTMTPAPESGLPYGVSGGAIQPGRALAAARKTIDAALAAPVNAAELAAGKNLLTNSYSLSLADPAFYVDAVLMRYAYGKDVLTGYAARIGAVTAEKVAGVNKALSEGMRIEYVIK